MPEHCTKSRRASVVRRNIATCSRSEHLQRHHPDWLYTIRTPLGRATCMYSVEYHPTTEKVAAFHKYLMTLCVWSCEDDMESQVKYKWSGKHQMTNSILQTAKEIAFTQSDSVSSSGALRAFRLITQQYRRDRAQSYHSWKHGYASSSVHRIYHLLIHSGSAYADRGLKIPSVACHIGGHHGGRFTPSHCQSTDVPSPAPSHQTPSPTQPHHDWH